MGDVRAICKLSTSLIHVVGVGLVIIFDIIGCLVQIAYSAVTGRLKATRRG